MDDKMLVRVTDTVILAAKVSAIYDNRRGDAPKQFVRVVMTNKVNLDIPTDCGARMAKLAEDILSVRSSENRTEMVKTMIDAYIFEEGQVAVQTGIKPNVYRLLAVDEKLALPGQSGREREIVPADIVTL